MIFLEHITKTHRNTASALDHHHKEPVTSPTVVPLTYISLPQMAKEEPIILDPYGDVQLRVGAEGSGRVTFTVCSRTLARISPVFDRMLYGYFAESKKATTSRDDWIVDLPDDKPAAMEIFLNVAHSNFRKVPRVLSVDDLYDVTALTNYYDATMILSPWVDRWISSIDDIAQDANLLMPKLLWISWELGRKDTLITTSRRMLMESEGPRFAECCEIEDIQTPPDIVGKSRSEGEVGPRANCHRERIDAIRVQTIQSLLDIISDMVDKLIVVDERPRWCRHAEWMGPHRCESMILGSMTFCLARAHLWPIPDPELVEYSVLGLYGKLTSLIIHDIGEVTERPGADHHQCNPRQYLLAQIQRVMAEIPNPLTDLHVKALQEQEQKLRI